MPDNPATIVLVHGALTDASVWHPVIVELRRRGRNVLAPAMPMRNLATDVAYLHSYLDTLDGPLVVAGHSYGGSIISDARALTPAVAGLVFVAAFQPDTGETASELNYRFPGSLLAPDTTIIRPSPAGDDMYLRPERFADVYAHDVEADTCTAMANAQHPIDPAALNESFTGTPTWRTLPSWCLVATADRSIPTEAQRFMAARAASMTVEINSSHAVPVAHPADTVDIIAAAARAA